MDADGANARALTRNEIEETGAELSPDNSQVLFLADTNERFEPYYNTNDLRRAGRRRNAAAGAAGFHYAIDDAAWSPDGKSIIAVVNMGVHSEIVPDRRRIASARSQLTDGGHFIPPRRRMRSCRTPARWCFSSTSRRGSATCGRCRLPAAAPTRVTGTLRCARARLRAAAPGKGRVEGRRRRDHRGRAVLSGRISGRARGIRSSCRCTAGRCESDKFGAGPGLLLNYFPVLAAKGYAVLRPNYRGSTGYGNAFYRDVVGRYFSNMATDVMAGVDALIAQGIADPDRLVVMGWSAGGTLVNKLVTMTDRFKAASSGAGVANWMSLYAQTDTRSFARTWFGGTPWQKNAPIDAVLEQLAAQGRRERQDADTVLRRRRRHARADGRSRSRCIAR